MTPSEMYAEFQSYLDVDSSFLSGPEVWRKLDNANKEICRIISREDPTYFVQKYTFTTVADQVLYDLPLNARLGSRILFTEDDDDSVEILPVQELRVHLNYDSAGIVNLTSNRFILENDQVRLMSNPSSGQSITVWYIPSFGQMIEGEVQSATTTTFAPFTVTPNYSLNYGSVDARADYYNGMTVQILSNDGVGDVRKISDYAGGSSKTATISSAWSTTPTPKDSGGSSVSTFAISSPVPEDFHQMVPMRAAIDGAIKNRNRLSELQSTYYGSPGRGGMEKGLLAWLQKRHQSDDEIVVPDGGSW